MEPDEYDKYREMVVEGAKAIFDAGLVVHGEGNVSVRVKDTDEFFITPSQNDYANFTKDDVVHMRMDGTQLSKGKPKSTEYKLHIALYEARKKVQSVVHLHSPYAGMLSVAKKEIPVFYEEIVKALGGPIKISKYSVAGEEAIGQNVVEAIGKANACLIENHFGVVCGRNVKRAVKAAIALEKTAQVYWGALQIGNVEPIPEKNLQKAHSYFDALDATYSKRKK
ncbi:MAG: class II aldolase/adducin family protein [Candidatus Hodarchaeota archaeon]